MQYFVDSLFADAARTVPLLSEPLASPPAAGALAAGVSGDSSAGPFDGSVMKLTSFGRVGAQRASTTYYDRWGMIASVPPGYGLWEIVLEPVDLVELSEVRTRLAGDIAVRELHGSDGSRLFATDLYDTAHAVTLELRRNAPGGARLLPPRAYGLSYHFAPPPGGTVSPAWCGAPDAMFGLWAFGGPRPRFVATDSGATFGVVLQTGALYGCSSGGGLDAPPQPVTLTSGTGTVLTACASVPVTDWTPVTNVTLGSGRLTRSVDAIHGVPFSPPHIFQMFSDSALSSTCMAAIAEDGVLRCLPTGATAAVVAYTDVLCTARVASWTSLGPPSYVMEGSRAPGGFPTWQGALAFYAVGAPLPPTPIYFRAEDGTCHLAGNFSAFEIGEPIPSSTFVAFELRDAPPSN